MEDYVKSYILDVAHHIQYGPLPNSSTAMVFGKWELMGMTRQ